MAFRNNIVFVFLFLFKLNLQAQENYYDYRLIEVVPNIYVSVRPEPLRHTVEGNFIIIINKSDVVLVDATGTPYAARKVISDIRKLTKNPVTYLINTHFHGDHTMGNQAFKDTFQNIEIVTSAKTAEVQFNRAKSFSFFLLNDSIFKKRRADLDKEISELSKANMEEYDLVIKNKIRQRDKDIFVVRELQKEIRITPPTLVIDKELILYRDDREIHIMHLGAGDTPGDTWIYLPKEKILIAGDAVVHPVPFGFSADPVEWIKTLEKAAALDFNILIPGHGETQFGKGYLLKLIELLKVVNTQVESLAKQGMSKDEIKAGVKITKLRDGFTQDQRFLNFYFNEYFLQPILETLIKRYSNK